MSSPARRCRVRCAHPAFSPLFESLDSRFRALLSGIISIGCRKASRAVVCEAFTHKATRSSGRKARAAPFSLRRTLIRPSGTFSRWEKESKAPLPSGEGLGGGFGEARTPQTIQVNPRSQIVLDSCALSRNDGQKVDPGFRRDDDLACLGRIARMTASCAWTHPRDGGLLRLGRIATMTASVSQARRRYCHHASPARISGGTAFARRRSMW